MRLPRRIGSFLLFLLMIGIWLWLEKGEAPRTISAANGAAVHVIDGDSLRIGGEEIRIAGIDAPEYRQQCGDGASGQWPCGKAARDELARLAAAGGLGCTERAKDRYGRSLASCRAGGRDLGSAMAEAGLALGAGDERFAEPVREMAQARAAKRGIWQGPHIHPAEWRKSVEAQLPRGRL